MIEWFIRFCVNSFEQHAHEIKEILRFGQWKRDEANLSKKWGLTLKNDKKSFEITWYLPECYAFDYLLTFF